MFDIGKVRGGGRASNTFRFRSTQKKSSVEGGTSAQGGKLAQQVEAEKAKRAQQRASQELARISQKIDLPINHKLKYFVDPASRKVMVRVIDSSTNKVIKELPPEYLRNFHTRIQEFIGLLIDEDA